MLDPHNFVQTQQGFNKSNYNNFPQQQINPFVFGNGKSNLDNNFNSNRNVYSTSTLEKQQILTDSSRQPEHFKEVNNNSSFQKPFNSPIPINPNLATPVEADGAFIYNDQKIRINFIRKVYLILSLQFLLTVLWVIIPQVSQTFNEFQVKNYWISIVCSVVSIIIIYALACFKYCARKVPLNYILLIIFTMCKGYIVSVIAAASDPPTVLLAAGLTLGIFVMLTVYAIFTKSDFTTCWGLFFAFIGVIIVGSIAAYFFRNKWVNLVVAIAIAFIMCFYIVVDTQLIVGNKSRMLTIDDYIMGAMILYIDVIQLFLMILQILGTSKR